MVKKANDINASGASKWVTGTDGADTKDLMIGEMKSFTVRIPVTLHKRAMYHRVETGESVNSLIVRLLAQELGD
jgi:predicted HicB family RNase H-like nuclease